MSFISYAQNYEDVMLWRALGHIKNGFYIDVGANDPTNDSVTRAFYERGWCGINIEPLPAHYADLVKDRPNDINLQCAAGENEGLIDIWECDVRGWATASSAVVQQHNAEGYQGVFHKIPVHKLSSICQCHVTGDIHFLKIDVEGFEKEVIEGADFSQFRPWVLVVEATRPNSTEEVHDQWESLIVLKKYVFVYTDGINRFYVARERSDLLTAFRYPPNVLDNFIRFDQSNAEAKAQQAEAKAQQAEAKAQQAEAKAQQAEAKAQQAEAKAQQAEAKAQQAEIIASQHLALIRSLQTSRSWRFTAPLRWFSIQARLVRTAGIKSRIKALAKKVLRKISYYLLFRPSLRGIIVLGSERLGLYQTLKLLQEKVSHKNTSTYTLTRESMSPPKDLQGLSLQARKIYNDLKQAVADQQKKTY